MGHLLTTLLFIYLVSKVKTNSVIDSLTKKNEHCLELFFINMLHFSKFDVPSGDIVELRPQPTSRWRSRLRRCTTSPRVRSRWCHCIVSLTFSFRPHCGPGVDSNSNRNKYQKYFLGVNGRWSLLVRFPMVLLEFFIDIIFLAALWPWGWLNL